MDGVKISVANRFFVYGTVWQISMTEWGLSPPVAERQAT